MYTEIAIFGYMFVAALSIVAIATLFVEKMQHSKSTPEEQVDYLMKYSRMVQERNAVKQQYLRNNKPGINVDNT